MKFLCSSIGCACLFILSAARTESVALETHAAFQAVDEAGVSQWNGPTPFQLVGGILNAPEEMLDTAWASEAEADQTMGAQWQVFIQAVGMDDRGGTACWMGQNYSSLGPWIPEGQAYSRVEWEQELNRLALDPASGHRFAPGDLVRVHGNKSLFYGGKRNVNESHRVVEANDFVFELISPRYGLPEAEPVRLRKLTAVDDGDPTTHEDLFDPSRQTGGERYQGMRVCLEGVRLASEYFGSTGWGQDSWADRRCTVTDGEGRFFTLRMPRTDLGSVPAGWFSAVGILNQESGSGSDGTFGYELFVQEIGPILRTAYASGHTMVYWPADYSGYTLERAESLLPPVDWIPVDGMFRKFLVWEDSTGQGSSAGFYRLRLTDGDSPSPILEGDAESLAP